MPLLDEAAELLGEFSAQADASAREREQQRLRDIENAEQAIENMGVGGMVTAERLAEGFAEQAARRTTAERAASDRTWTYGHIVVDEAQELSPMQWRVLLRRCPLRSFTIVGDVAQASSAVGVTSWQDALGPVLGREWRLEELTVNYRTPARIAEAAERMAIAHGLPVTRSRPSARASTPSTRWRWTPTRSCPPWSTWWTRSARAATPARWRSSPATTASRSCTARSPSGSDPRSASAWAASADPSRSSIPGGERPGVRRRRHRGARRDPRAHVARRRRPLRRHDPAHSAPARRHVDGLRRLIHGTA
ncbi:hypothetical protein BC477_11170 [Clavibacter michiganensis subsp. michiganensis]|uniref:Uncharacterized protein n=1 Tax=Clavibacter michiganensis subsp. michiganensis TaxID=33013 RepID=A0A251XH03_CLAMM|nr:hypothetical protein BC477_11170 [Clavibacter michiganensis subsp. michiganensis]OUE02355.1 hypothetical protein CMMCAS07_10085 [Clavibacter michiganensis subsp. michiganensis]